MPPCCCDDGRAEGRCGSIEWIGALARDHASQLVAVARREGLEPADALDAVQDAFQTLLARADASALRERPDDAAHLLVAIVRNAARNARRRHHRSRPHVDIDGEALVASAPAPDAVLANADAAAQLAGCMASLGEVHRSVVMLRVLEELSGDEAARALGMSAGNVAVLLHRARKQLERCMQDAESSDQGQAIATSPASARSIMPAK